jgi:pre-mRNA-splicing factor SYF2/beta-D-xylosidase 4
VLLGFCSQLQGFLKPPGAGTAGVPRQTLFGFERVHVPAGQTVTVFLYPTLLDLTHVDAEGRRQPLAGHVRVQFGIPETAALGQGFAEHSFVTEL